VSSYSSSENKYYAIISMSYLLLSCTKVGDIKNFKKDDFSLLEQEIGDDQYFRMALLHKGLKDRAPLEDPNLSYNSGLRSA